MEVTLGEQLKYLIKASGPGPKVVSHRSGISVREINAIMSGERLDPSISTLMALARALDISLDWLAGLPRREADPATPDEEELLRMYREIPEGYLKKAVLDSLRAQWKALTGH